MSEKKGYRSLWQIVGLAVEFEEESARFYHEMKNQAPAENARTLLELLEAQEIEHKKTLLTLKSKDELENVFIQFPPEFKFAMPEMKKENPSFADWLGLAIEREIISAEIYERSSASAPRPVRLLFEGLAEFERSHERNLKQLKPE